MELKDLVTKVTTIIGNYIKNGWIFNPGTMGGSQGEIVKVDLTKDLEAGPTTTRIAINKVCRGVDDYYRFTIEAFDRSFTSDSLGATLWNGRGNYILDEYYGVKEDGSIFYFGSEGDIEQAHRKHVQRWNYKSFNDPTKEVDSKYYGLIRSIVSRFDIPGWKRFEIKDVTTWRNRAGSVDYRVLKNDGHYFQFYRVKDKIFYYTNN